MKEIKALETVAVNKLQREYIKNNTVLRLIMEEANKAKLVAELGQDAFNEIINDCCSLNESLFKMKKRSALLCWF